MQTTKNNILLMFTLLMIVGQSNASSLFACLIDNNDSAITQMEMMNHTTSYENLDINLDMVDSNQTLNNSTPDCCGDKEHCYMTGCTFSIANYLPLFSEQTLVFQAVMVEKSMIIKQFPNSLYRPPILA